jgi:hypothetical protein
MTFCQCRLGTIVKALSHARSLPLSVTRGKIVKIYISIVVANAALQTQAALLEARQRP